MTLEGKRMFQNLAPILRRRFGNLACRRGVHSDADARLHDVHKYQADHQQRKCRQDFEIENRLRANAAHRP